MASQSSSSGSSDIDAKLDAFGEDLSMKLLSSSALRLAPFTNAPGQDLEEWLQKYEFAATGQGWNKDKMGERIGTYLAGPARAWFTVNIKDNTAGPFDYDQIIKLMAKAFLATGYQQHLREMVRKRKQGLYESVANYIFVIQKLLERMDKSGQIDEEERVQRIIEGMLPPIAGQVIPYQPTTFEELLEKAKLVEWSLQMQAKGEHAHFAAEALKPIPTKETKKEKTEDFSKVRINGKIVQ